MESKPIKLTSTSYALLALLEQFGPATSYEIKQALGELDPELLAGPPHDRLRGAGAPRRGRLPLGRAGGGGPAPPRLLADRAGAARRWRAWATSRRGPAAAARRADAEGLRRRRPGAAAAAAGRPGTGRSSRSCRATSSWFGKTRATRAPSERWWPVSPTRKRCWRCWEFFAGVTAK